ncbi:MAG: hypothetical protein JSV80_03100, partial [Acidobacteriota bacterium]
MDWKDRLFTRLPRWGRTLAFNAYAARLRRLREGPALEEAMEALDTVDRAPAGEVERAQLERINELLDWACERVPYYRSILSAQDAPRRPLTSLAQLKQIPTLPRETLRQRPDDVTVPGLARATGYTSGSTGSPMPIRYDERQLVWNRAAEMLVRRRAGLERRDRVAVLFGRSLVPPRRRKPPFWIHNRVSDELWLSLSHLGEKTARHYLAALRDYSAAALDTYPSMAYLLACLSRKLREPVQLRRVITSSEPLYPFQRATIEEVFRAEVFEF